MKKEALALFGNPDLILFGLLLFVACFAGILIWTFAKSNKEKFQLASQIPLHEEPVTGDLKNEE